MPFTTKNAYFQEIPFLAPKMGQLSPHFRIFDRKNQQKDLILRIFGKILSKNEKLKMEKFE